MRIELHPEARAELRAAALWYEERRSRWGDQFLDRVNAGLALIAAHPAAYPRWPGTAHVPVPIRKAAIGQFPYFLAFEIHASHFLVLAVAHAKRRPLYWLSRASREPG